MILSTDERRREREGRTLELSAAEMRALFEAAARRAIAYVESLPQQPSADTEGGAALARELIGPMPETGRPAEELLDLVFGKVVRKGFGTAGPGYLAYIPGGGLVHSAVADFVAAAVNRYVGVFAAAPGLAAIEANVVRWFCDLVGYPASAGGFLTTGGSLANFSALLTARRERLPDDFLGGVLYASDQTHHSVEKAAMLAGFPADRVRLVASDEEFRLRVGALESAVARDREAGLRPFLVVGNAGTTNTGAVDDLDALADLCDRERLWLHVDGAYGGFFVLTEEGRCRLRGISRADSIVLDPHKGLFLPYGTGSLLVKDAAALRRAHALSADYMPPMQDEPDLVDFNMISPELSRGWRGLRVWLPISMHGIGPFRANLEEKLALTRWAANEIRKIPQLEIVAEPQLSIVAFRLVPTRGDPETENARNRAFLDAINARKRVYLTGTMLGRGTARSSTPRFVLRICVLSFRTHMDRMRMALDDIRAAADDARG